MKIRWVTILLLLAIAGLGAGSWGLYQRLAFGLQPVAFGSHVPWGLWVSLYLFFLGLSAGAFLVTSLAYVFGLKRFENIGPLAAFTVLVALACEAQFILLDLGTMHRAFYRFFLSPSFSSLMTWMLVFFSAMGALYAVKTYVLLKSLRPSDRATATRNAAMVRRLSLLSLPVGLLFYGTNGAFFAVIAGRPLWNDALTPVLFVVAALLSGGALVTLLTYIFRRASDSAQPAVRKALCLELGNVLLGLLILFTLLEALQIFIGYKTARTDLLASLDTMLFGPAMWSFWIVHVLFGTITPLLLLASRAKTPKSVAWACFLIVASFIAVRYNFIVPDLTIQSLPGLDAAFVHPRLSPDYAPNLMEWLVSIWVVSSGLLMFLLGVRFLPVTSDTLGGERHV